MTEWVRHTGTECPVDPGATVHVELANGKKNCGVAMGFSWLPEGIHTITRYRLASEEQKPDPDVGKHYRYEYKGVKLDPYRVCKIYGLDGGPREHIVKKGLRGVSKGHTELELVAELRSCLDRWEEMITEDDESK